MPQKGFDRLVSAWRIVSRKHPDWTLSIYGDGMREQLQRQVDEEGVGFELPAQTHGAEYRG